MKQLTKKGFWRGIFFMLSLCSLITLGAYFDSNSTTVLTANEILISVLLFCSFVLFGYAVIWNEGR